MNPRPYRSKKAVALRYKPDQEEAPTVTAKGKGRIAEQILEKAREHGVPIQEDPSLVEVLASLDLDQKIPPELYQLVAEVLTFVYQSDRNAQLKARGYGDARQNEPQGNRQSR